MLRRPDVRPTAPVSQTPSGLLAELHTRESAGPGVCPGQQTTTPLGHRPWLPSPDEENQSEAGWLLG